MKIESHYMKNIFRFISSIAAWSSGASFTVLSIIAIHRCSLEYNSEGRYFDLSGSIVYDTDARDVYIALSFLFFILTALFIIVRLYLRKN